MNAIVKSHLTESEAQEAIDKAIEEKRKEWSFFLESFTEADNFLGDLLHRAYISRDWILFGDIMDQLAENYFKACGFDEKAQIDARE